MVWAAAAGPGARLDLVKMEFRRFLHAIVLVPAQIVRSGRRIIYRIMSYNAWLKDLFAAWEHLRRLRLIASQQNAEKLPRREP